MPKRKLKSSDDFDYLRKKLKKLERKIKRSVSRRVSVSSTDSDLPTPHNQQESEIIASVNDYTNHFDDTQPGCSYWNPNVTEESYIQSPIQQLSSEDQMAPNALTVKYTSPIVDAPPQVVEPTMVSQLIEMNDPEQAIVPQQITQELDPELMEILGEDPTSTNEFGSEIQKDLAIRLNHIATSGLAKDKRRELKERYLIPANCKFIKAPALNPEVRASLIESQAKRDKGIENKQVLTSCAMSSLSEAITHLLSSEQKDPILLKLLMDTVRILGDIQYMDSSSRRLFILSTLKKELKEQLEKTKIDEMLFGNNLTDIIKSAKTIIKSGADLRSSTRKPTSQKPAITANRSLNYRAPAAIRKQSLTGGTRYTRPTPSAPIPRQPTRTTYNSVSKTSSRQGQVRHRR